MRRFINRKIFAVMLCGSLLLQTAPLHAEDLFSSTSFEEAADPFSSVEAASSDETIFEEAGSFTESGQTESPIDMPSDDETAWNPEASAFEQTSVINNDTPGEDLFSDHTQSDQDMIGQFENPLSGEELFMSQTPSEDSFSDISGQDSAANDFAASASEEEFLSNEVTAGEEFFSGETDEEDSEEYPISRMIELPDPEFDYAVSKEIEMVGASLPAVYDPRSSGYVTPVKNQGKYGMCSTFATAANMEIYLRKNLADHPEYDLSEEHVGHFFAHRVNDPLGLTELDKNIVLPKDNYYAYHVGGNQFLLALFLSTWSGMAPESLVPYPQNDSDLKVLDSSLAYSTTAYLKDAVFTSYNYSDLDAAILRTKTLIQEYGSIGTSIYIINGSSYYNKSTYAYSYPGNADVTHALTIVGWDDTFPKENFKSISEVTRDGAWIVKNSWGPTWGDNGYFYISYECRTLKNMLAVSCQPSADYPNNYFYDGSSSFDKNRLSIAPEGSQGYTQIAQVFKAAAGHGSAEALREVVVADHTENVYYGVQVYTNLQTPSSPTSGVPYFATPKTFHKTYAGIATFDLGEDIILPQNSYYSIVLSNLSAKQIQYLTEDSTSADWITFEVGLNASQSFVYNSSENAWVDLLRSECCARIKAHTKTLNYAVGVDLSPAALNCYLGDVLPLSAAVTNVSLTDTNPYLVWKSSNTAVAAVDQNGMITAKKVGKTTITVSLLGLPSVKAVCQVTVQNVPAPDNFKVIPKTYRKIRLTWTPLSGFNILGYQVYRYDPSTKVWKSLGNVTASVGFFVDANALVGTEYHYRIRAYQKTDTQTLYGTYTPTLSGKTTLAQPVITVKSTAVRTNTISWAKIPGANGYIVYRKLTGASAFSRIAAITNGTKVTYKDAKAKSGKKYVYRIRAYRLVNGVRKFSKYSASKAIKTK